MKHLTTLLIVLCFALNLKAQTTWKPKPIPATTQVQCAGTTAKNERCKRMITPTHPGKAIIDGGGVYYCHQHVKQAKK